MAADNNKQSWKLSPITTEKMHSLGFFALVLGVNLALGTEEFHPRNHDAPTSCSHLPKLPVPGRGWDSLRDKEMSSVFETDYSKCETTLDGRFLIPNDFDSLPTKSSDIQMNTDMIQHWKNYSSLTSKSFNMQLGVDLSFLGVEIQISSSFSDGYREAKESMMKFESTFIRVSIEHRLYEVLTTPKARLDSHLEKQFRDVIDALNANNTDRAECLLEFIVRDYGTHYTTNVYNGAMLYQENYVETTEKMNAEVFSKELQASAAIQFMDIIKLPKTNYRQSASSHMLQTYQSLKIHKKIKTFGPSFKLGMTADEWQDKIEDDLVTVDKTGNPIFYLVTPSHFPNASPHTLKDMREKLQTIVRDYFIYNAHAGCMEQSSPNFDSMANIEGQCQNDLRKGHRLGGIYIRCTSTVYNYKAGDPCEMASNNPLTGDYSCPTGFSQVSLNSWPYEKVTLENDCDQKCSGWWLWKRCNAVCNTKRHASKANLASYWCSPRETASNDDGYVFGGIFTTNTNNDLTGKKVCPQSYSKIKIGEETWACVASSDEKQVAEFGGFFSCKSGNPLANNMHRCPSSFKQSIATIDNHCPVSYCYKPLARSKSYRNAELIRPPFKDISSRLFQPDQLTETQQNTSTVTDYSLIAGLILLLVIIVVIVSLSTYVYWYTKCRDGGNRDGQQPLVVTSELNLAGKPQNFPKPDLVSIDNPTLVRQNWGNIMHEMQQTKNTNKPPIPPKKPSIR